MLANTLPIEGPLLEGVTMDNFLLIVCNEKTLNYTHHE